MTIFRDHKGNIVLTRETTCTDTDGDMNEFVYTVTFSVESYGHSGNNWDDPGEAAEITIWEIRDSKDMKIESPAFDRLSELFEPKICEMVYLDGPESDYD